MSLPKKIVCGVLLAVVLGVGTLAVWQWNNISAALSFVRFSQEELEEKLVANDQTIKDAVAKVPEVTIREVTEEERAALRDGTMTQEELVQSLLQKPESEPKPEPEQAPKPQTTPQTKPDQKPEPQAPAQSTQQPQTEPEASAPPEKEPEPSEYEQQVNALIAEVFVLREEFLIKLDELMAQAMADYKALSPEDRTGSKLMGMVSDYLSKGLALEKECDARVEGICARLEVVQRENGGDLSLVDTVFDNYVNEKSLKKAWYMAELKKRGLI